MPAVARRDMLKLTSMAVVGSAAVQGTGGARAASQAGEWSQLQFGSRNTGYNPDTAVPKDTIKQVWRGRVKGGHPTGPIVSGDRVYFGSVKGTVTALDRASGEPVWEKQLESSEAKRMSVPLLHGGRLYVCRGKTVHVLDPQSGDRLGGISLASTSQTTLTAADGTVFFVDGNVRAVDGKTGKGVWKFTDDMFFDSGVAVADGTVYVGSNNGTLYALEAGSGAKQWKSDAGGEIKTPPVVTNGTVYVGTIDGPFLAVDAEDGTEQWRTSSGRYIHSPAVGEGVVVVNPDDEDGIRAYDAASGEEQWTYRGVSGFLGANPANAPAIADGTVILARDNVHAVDLQTGERRWQFPRGQFRTSPPAIADGIVYAGNWDGYMYALSTENAMSYTPSKRTATETGSVSTLESSGGGGSSGGSNTAGSSTVASNENDQRQRGFFTNNGSGPDALENVFNLTVLGFLLSVGGIIHQLLGGR